MGFRGCGARAARGGDTPGVAATTAAVVFVGVEVDVGGGVGAAVEEAHDGCVFVLSIPVFLVCWYRWDMGPAEIGRSE